MSFIKRKKQPHLFRPDAWHAQKNPAAVQNVASAEPPPAVVVAPKKRTKKKARR